MVTFSKVREIGYEVNSIPDKNVTVAKISVCPTIAEEVEKYCKKSVIPTISMVQMLDGDIDSMYPGIKSKARCVEGDTFNEETGENIAIIKAEIKYRKKVKRLYERYLKRLKEAVREVEKLMEKNEKQLQASEREKKYIMEHL